MTTMYHGSGQSISAGTVLRPDEYDYVYVSPSRQWADAFGFNDAASAALAGEIHQALSMTRLVDLSRVRVPGNVYAVTTAGPFEPDPDYLNVQQSLRTRSGVVVGHGEKGVVTSWRAMTAILGPHHLWSGGEPAYDEEGYLQMPSDWQQEMGYATDDLRPLGRWCPHNSLYRFDSTLYVVSECVLCFLDRPADICIAELKALGGAARLTESNARHAGRRWWQ